MSEQDSCQDTDLDAAFGDDTDVHLDDELRARLEADDELASIFGSEDTSASETFVPKNGGFQRPCNPLIHDERFRQPRCSAPSFENQFMASTFVSKKREGFTFPSRFE
uniref:Uncharacterized protein n=1 Tax=Euplotes harpa TaxID=151035 RepID=A0A7S3JGG5_9SPIT|mmetsp:Transcript_3909/g.4769  ORF Transcript_3909/g.4769 Transcript_3909/m.4769 type:complete len:108 (+) Transcript_3909:320-643(+)